eukprot:gene23776-32161_t
MLLMNNDDPNVSENCCCLIDFVAECHGNDSEQFFDHLYNANIVPRLLKALRKCMETNPNLKTELTLHLLKELRFFSRRNMDGAVSDEFMDVSLSVLREHCNGMDTASLEITATVLYLMREYLSHVAGPHSAIRNKTTSSSFNKKTVVRVLEHLLLGGLGDNLADHFQTLSEDINLQSDMVLMQSQHGILLLLEGLEVADAMESWTEPLGDSCLHFSQRISSSQILSSSTSSTTSTEPRQLWQVVQRLLEKEYTVSEDSAERSKKLLRVFTLLWPLAGHLSSFKSLSSQSITSSSSYSSSSSSLSTSSTLSITRSAGDELSQIIDFLENLHRRPSPSVAKDAEKILVTLRKQKKPNVSDKMKTESSLECKSSVSKSSFQTLKTFFRRSNTESSEVVRISHACRDSEVCHSFVST